MQQPRWQDGVIAAGVYEDVRFVLLADEATPEQESLAAQAAACLHVSTPDTPDMHAPGVSMAGPCDGPTGASRMHYSGSAPSPPHLVHQVR